MTTTAKERPFNCTADEVRAIRDGRMTMFRRPVMPQPVPGRYGATHPTKPSGVIGYREGQLGDGDYHIWYPPRGDGSKFGIPLTRGCLYRILPHCPFGEVGDRLSVREAWQPRISHHCYENACDCADVNIQYLADGEFRYFDERDIPEEWMIPKSANSLPSSQMPQWASRDTLELMDVRVERLQGISDADCEAEGIVRRRLAVNNPFVVGAANVVLGSELSSYRTEYRDHWNARYAKPKPVRSGGIITHYVSYPWEDVQEVREHRGKEWRVMGNLFVWRNVFRRVEG